MGATDCIVSITERTQDKTMIEYMITHALWVAVFSTITLTLLIKGGDLMFTWAGKLLFGAVTIGGLVALVIWLSRQWWVKKLCRTIGKQFVEITETDKADPSCN